MLLSREADLSFLIGNLHCHQPEQASNSDERRTGATLPEEYSRRRTIVLNEGSGMQQDGTISWEPVVEISTLKPWQIVVAVVPCTAVRHRRAVVWWARRRALRTTPGGGGELVLSVRIIRARKILTDCLS